MIGSGSTAEPDFALALAKITRMSKDELNELLNKEEKAEEYIKSLDQVKALNNEKEELMVANKSLAEYNLTQEPILKRKKEQLTTKHSDAVQLLATVNALKDELASKSGKIQPDVLYNLLEVEVSKAEHDSDQIVTDYLDKKFDSTDEFLEKYVALRKVMYLRRVKFDKMGELMKNPQDNKKTPARRAPEPPPPAANYQAPSGSSGAPYPPANWNSPSSGANLPYPLKPTMMPSPNFR